MPFRDGATLRKERLSRTLQFIAEHSGEFTDWEAIMRLSYELGLTPEKVEEYITVLAHCGFIEMRGGRLYVTEKRPGLRPV